VSRLITAINLQPRTGFGGNVGEPTVWGDVTVNSLLLSVNAIGFNSFKTYAGAKLFSLERGTRVEGTLSVHPAIRRLMQVWLAGSFLIGLPVLWDVIATLKYEPSGFKNLSDQPFRSEIWCLGIFAVMVPMYFIGRAASRQDGMLLKRFLMQNLDAQEDLGCEVGVHRRKGGGGS
jgi:hypothetical protein